MAKQTEVIIYTRFSPRPDAATSESCELQEQQCREFAAQKGWSVRDVYNDSDVSGKDKFRSKLWAAIAALKKGDILLVTKRDRLARDLYLAECINNTVSRQKASICAISGDVDGDGPEAVLIRQVVAAMAEYERKLIGQRTSAALRAYQKSGRRVSAKPPYGWTVDPDDPKHLIRNEREQEVIASIVSMRKIGMSFYTIADKLPPERARSGKWHHYMVSRIYERAVH